MLFRSIEEMTTPLNSHALIVGRAPAATPTVFTDIAELSSVALPEISRNEFDAIWTDLVMLMSAGTKKGRIDTVRPEHLPEVMGRLARVDRHGGEVYVYRREGKDCYLCDSAVLMADMTGRKLYWCPTCQSA